MESTLTAIAQFPHCDALVLHAPGKCEFCDKHPDWQELRVLWGINFTGERDPSKVLCPAEQRRPLEKIERWPGNTPEGYAPPETTLSDGSVVTPDHREIDPKTGQQKGYVVLSANERAKGFVRPVRRNYKHKTCGVITVMGTALAETYARDPKFYSATFCVSCRAHFPLDQFVWDGTNEQVGS